VPEFKIGQTVPQKKLKPGLVAFYNIQPGNGAGLFLKEKISKGEISNKKVKKNG